MKIIFLPPFSLQRSADKEEDIRRNLEGLAQIFENYIRRSPAEYLWFYKIWKYSGQRNILLLSDGKAGHLLQAKTAASLACSVLKEKGIDAKVDTVEVKYKNKFAQRALTFSSLLAGKHHCQGCLWCLRKFLTPDCYRQLAAKRYELVISCGSSLAPVNYVLSRENLARSIVLMRPSVLGLRRFDLVLIPWHDQPVRQWFGFPYSQSHRPPRRKNVAVIRGALNPVNEDYLENQAQELRPYAKIETDLAVGVFIGGNNKNFRLGSALMQDVVRQLKDFAQKENAELLVTTSRRTPAPVEALLKQEFGGYPRCKLLVIANEKNMPFVSGGILGLSNMIITSPESISMISEAVNSRKPVLVFTATGIGRKHRRFLNRLAAEKKIFLCRADALSRMLGDIQLQKPQMSGLGDDLIVREALKRIL
jgi:mitochondrial fission protein ELM1